MIPKAKVAQVGLHRVSARLFSVAGYGGKLGYYPAHRRRTFKTYQCALDYSIVLRDYYQAPVVEF